MLTLCRTQKNTDIKLLAEIQTVLLCQDSITGVSHKTVSNTANSNSSTCAAKAINKNAKIAAGKINIQHVWWYVLFSCYIAWKEKFLLQEQLYNSIFASWTAREEKNSRYYIMYFLWQPIFFFAENCSRYASFYIFLYLPLSFALFPHKENNIPSRKEQSE